MWQHTDNSLPMENHKSATLNLPISIKNAYSQREAAPFAHLQMEMKHMNNSKIHPAIQLSNKCPAFVKPAGYHLPLRLFRLMAVILALTLGSGCDSGSSDKTSSRVTNPGTPPPWNPNIPAPTPQPIPDETLPRNDQELNVIAAFPGPGEPRVALISPITIEFDDALISGIDLATALTIRSSDNKSVDGTISQPDLDRLVFHPKDLWNPKTTYTIQVNPALMSARGLKVNAQLRWQFITAADVYTTPQRVIDECMSELDEEMLAAVNQARSTARSCGSKAQPAVAKLTWNCLLQEAAIIHSDDMAAHNFFEHIGSDGSRVSDRVTRTGYNWHYVGENLAGNVSTVTQAMSGLLNSPGHCENIMSKNFTEFGFGFARSGNRTYWTQVFATHF